MGGEDIIITNTDTIEYPHILYTTFTSGIYFNYNISPHFTLDVQSYFQAGNITDGRKLWAYFLFFLKLAYTMINLV